MPQATSELRAKFPDQDREALEVLEANFSITQGGLIVKRVEGYKLTPREWEAINYLFQEWDYCYGG